jgi:hypothetical protein
VDNSDVVRAQRPYLTVSTVTREAKTYGIISFMSCLVENFDSLQCFALAPSAHQQIHASLKITKFAL